jgi:hypothetical protein
MGGAMANSRAWHWAVGAVPRGIMGPAPWWLGERDAQRLGEVAACTRARACGGAAAGAAGPSELGRQAGRRRAGPGSRPGRGGGQVGRWRRGRGAGPREGKGRPISFLFIYFLFPLFVYFFFLFLVLSYFLHDVKSNSLLNPCSTKSLIKQSESMLQHDATIKALKWFQFTRLTCRYKTK